MRRATPLHSQNRVAGADQDLVGRDTLADLAQRSLLARVEAFQRRNPGIKIAPWYATLSKLWEVSGPGDGTTLYDNGFRMMDDLEERFPECQ
jgi:hypothetical protein